MTTLYTVAYPDISTADATFIEAFRYENDLPYRDVVAAHFVMVFGCSKFRTAVIQLGAAQWKQSLGCLFYCSIVAGLISPSSLAKTSHDSSQSSFRP